MEQRVEYDSELIQQKKPVRREKQKTQKRLDTSFKIHEIVAAPDYLFLSSTEFIQHFTNMFTTDQKYDLWEEHKNKIKVVGYCNRGILDTLLRYFREKNDDLTIATTPLHHTSWRNGQEKHVKLENIHIIELNDRLNGTEKYPDIEKCDLVLITHMFGQDLDLKGLAEFKEKTRAIVIEDRVQGGTLNMDFSDPLVDISIMSMAMDKKPIALGGGYAFFRKNFRKIAEDIHANIKTYPVEPNRKRYIDLLKKIPTFLLYNKKRFLFWFLRLLRAIKFDTLEFTNMYRKKNPGFEREDITYQPSNGLLKSMSQHYHDFKVMERVYEEKHMIFRSYLPDHIIYKYFPWYRDAALTPYNTIYIDEQYVDKFLKFMNRSNTVIIWNPTYKMFNMDNYPEKYVKIFNGLVYLPCLANMNREEIRYLADRIEKFDEMIGKKT